MLQKSKDLALKITQNCYNPREDGYMAKNKIWQRITSKNWCQDLLDNQQGAHCALGWINKVYAPDSAPYDDSSPVKTSLRKYLAKKSKKKTDELSIAQWNDSPKRKFSEVKAAFKAIDA
jgi:hypothetical protein